ncbi:MAG: hypothetical protein QOJ66_2778, partial [Ilumatobacteraceae bacterium]
MVALDERLEAATRELHEVLDKASFRPASAVRQRHQRRRHAVTVFAAIITVLAVVGLGFLVTRDVEPIEPGSSTSDPAAARLLFPAGAGEADIQSLYLGPDLPTAAKVIIEAPDGALFRVAISDRGGWQETPNVERRDFNGRTFTVEPVDSELAYVSLNDCAVVGVDQWAPAAQAWDTDASALLDAMTINGLTANVALPPGWKSFGASNGAHLIQLAFTSKAGGSLRGVVLMQAPDSGVAAIFRVAPADGAFMSTTFNNQRAWTVSDSADSTVSLIWQDGANAVVLSGQATLEELKQIAASLEHNHAADWARLLPSAENLSGTQG